MSDVESSSDKGNFSDVDYADMRLNALTMQEFFDTLQINGRRVNSIAMGMTGGPFTFWTQGVYTPNIELEVFIRNSIVENNTARRARRVQTRSPVFDIDNRSVNLEVIIIEENGTRLNRTIRYTPRADFQIYRGVMNRN